jgi:hypothetical protein
MSVEFRPMDGSCVRYLNGMCIESNDFLIVVSQFSFGFWIECAPCGFYNEKQVILILIEYYPVQLINPEN